MGDIVVSQQQYYKPGNLLQSGVLGQNGTLLATHGDVVLSNGIITFSNGESVVQSAITAYVITDYTAPQNQVSVVDFSSIYVADGIVYKLVFNFLAVDVIPQGLKTIAIVSNTGSTAASIAAQLQAAINNNGSFPVSATLVGNVLVLAEVNNWTQGFDLVAPTGAIVQTVIYQTTGTVTGTAPAIGDTLSQATSGATGTVVSIPSTGVIGVYVTSTAAFDTSHTVTDSPGGGTWTPSANVVESNIQASGTPYEVNRLTSINPPVFAGQYRLYEIQYNNSAPNSMIGGQLANNALMYV